jgi:hypothetical protein
MLEGGDLVVQLDEDRLRRHLPVHAEGLVRGSVFRLHPDLVLAKESLPFRPDGPCGVECLQLDADEISWLPVADRYKAVIDATAWNREFGNDSQLVARFVKFEQVDAVGEDLTAFQEAKRANHHGLWLPTIDHRTGADGNLRLTLAVLEALPLRKGQFCPIATAFQSAG